MPLLAEHPEFSVLVQNTSESLSLRPALVLKDYWVTAMLRVLAKSPYRGSLLFKGGTSLSKGWKLIDRFSEDVDLLLTGPHFAAPSERKGDRERSMKAIREHISKELPLRIPNLKDKHFYSRDEWHMEARYVWGNQAISSVLSEESVFLEAGFRGGANPYELVSLNSMVGDYLLGQSPQTQDALRDYRADFASFELELLSPVRTFFEKLLHLYTHLYKDANKVRTRHLYDVIQIFRKVPGVKALLTSGKYHDILGEAIAISNQWYQAQIDPAKVNLREGLILRDEVILLLSKSYISEKDYYFRGQPPFDELQTGLEEIRNAFPL